MKNWKMVVLMAVSLVLSLTFMASAAANLEMSIPRVASAPAIDGELNDGAWVNVSAKGGKFVSDIASTGAVLTQYPRVAYVGYDDAALYVAYVVYAPDATKLEGSLPSWWHNDEVEIILDPGQKGLETGAKPIQYGITAGGYVSSEDITAVVKVAGIKMVVEAAVPWSALGVSAPAKGDKWGFHLSGHQVDGNLWLSHSQASSFLQAPQMAVAIFGE